MDRQLHAVKTGQHQDSLYQQQGKYRKENNIEGNPYQLFFFHARLLFSQYITGCRDCKIKNRPGEDDIIVFLFRFF